MENVRIIRDPVTGRACKYNVLSKKRVTAYELDEYMEVWEEPNERY